MKTRFLLPISIMTSLFLSLTATLASYFYFTAPFIVDAGVIYRGWPLHWMTETWSSWSPPPYPRHVTLQLFNFFIDFVFYAIMFQVPMLAYKYSKEARKIQALAPKSDSQPTRALSYFSHGLSYSRRVNPETDGNATFPILPASVEIAVGNLAMNRASARITATYFY